MTVPSNVSDTDLAIFQHLANPRRVDFNRAPSKPQAHHKSYTQAPPPVMDRPGAADFGDDNDAEAPQALHVDVGIPSGPAIYSPVSPAVHYAPPQQQQYRPPPSPQRVSRFAERVQQTVRPDTFAPPHMMPPPLPVGASGGFTHAKTLRPGPMPLGRPPIPQGHPPMPLGHSPMPLGHSPMPLGHPPMPLGRPPVPQGVQPPSGYGAQAYPLAAAPLQMPAAAPQMTEEQLRAWHAQSAPPGAQPYNESGDETHRVKQRLLQEVKELKRNGYVFSREPTAEDTIEEIQGEIDSGHSFLEMRQAVGFVKDGIPMVYQFLEIANNKWGPFVPIQGFTDELLEKMDKNPQRYNYVLERMYRRYWRKGSMSPFMEFLWVFVAPVIVFMGKRKFLGAKAGNAASSEKPASAAAPEPPRNNAPPPESMNVGASVRPQPPPTGNYFPPAMMAQPTVHPPQAPVRANVEAPFPPQQPPLVPQPASPPPPSAPPAQQQQSYAAPAPQQPPRAVSDAGSERNPPTSQRKRLKPPTVSVGGLLSGLNLPPPQPVVQTPLIVEVPPTPVKPPQEPVAPEVSPVVELPPIREDPDEDDDDDDNDVQEGNDDE